MAVSASLSLYGIFQYDDTILDGLNVPTGMDPDTVKNMLLIETAGMSILYPDAPFLKKAIALWSAERSDVWQKLYNTTVLEYDPIENYDRREESSEENIGNELTQSAQERSTDSQTSGSSLEHRSGETVGSSQEHRSGDNTATAANTAYNSNDFADTSKSTSSGHDDSTGSTLGSTSDDVQGSTVTAGSGKENVAGSENRSKSDLRRLTSRIHGNIGVTTSQQMIMSEREVAEFCMVDYIVNDFISRFCVMVY